MNLRTFAQFGILTAMVVLTPTMAHAQTPSAGSCPLSQRFSNWDDYIQHGLSYTDWTENWKDIFVRNACQRDDILVLQDRLDRARQQIRQKIYACQEQGLDHLTAVEQRLQTELEYVRRIVDSNPERPASDANSDVLARSRTVVYREMYNELVINRKVYNKDTFDQLFLDIEATYSGRVKDYMSCKNPEWSELTKDWNTFVDSYAGTKPAWERLSSTVSQKWDRLLNSPSGHAGNILGGFVDVTINRLEPQQALSDIVNKLKKNNPLGLNPSYVDVLTQYEGDQERYTVEEDRLKRLARYEALYRNGQDAAVLNLTQQSIRLNDALQKSFPILENLHQCTAYVDANQCRNAQ